MKVAFVQQRPVVQHWTGAEIRRLRLAKRMSVRRFAQVLGVSDRMVSKWEAGGASLSPRPHNQIMLDQMLELCEPAQILRFAGLDDPPPGLGAQELRPLKPKPKKVPSALPRRDDYERRYDAFDEVVYDRHNPFWAEPRTLTILGRRDIAGLYSLLQNRGVSQRRIANLTGQSQSEVSEIMSGRVVSNYDVLVRICVGLGIPRSKMGLSYGNSPGKS